MSNMWSSKKEQDFLTYTFILIIAPFKVCFNRDSLMVTQVFCFVV